MADDRGQAPDDFVPIWQVRKAADRKCQISCPARSDSNANDGTECDELKYGRRCFAMRAFVVGISKPFVLSRYALCVAGVSE